MNTELHDVFANEKNPPTNGGIAKDLSFREGQAAKGTRARRGLKPGRGT